MIYEDKDQQNCLKMMQTREELYDFLNYHDQEQAVDLKLRTPIKD